MGFESRLFDDKNKLYFLHVLNVLHNLTSYD